MTRLTESRGFAPKAAAIALAIAALPLAYAETGPFYVGARQSITRDSNVYRTPTPTADWISSTGVFAGVDQQISRQRLRVNVAGDWNRYRDTEALNHTSGSGLVRLDWETIGNLSGDVQLNHSQNLYRDYLRAADATTKTVVRSTNGAFNARLGVVTTWTLEGGVFGTRTRYRGGLAQAGDLDYDGARVGLRYNPSSLLSVGIGVRRAEGEYPNAARPLDFRREDADLLLTWRPTATSTVDGWVSRSRWRFTQDQLRSDDLTTGSLRYSYRPGGRWHADLSIKRDNNAGQYGFDSMPLVGRELVLTDGQAATTRVATTVALNGGYEITAKTRLSANFQRIERKMDNRITETIAGLPNTVVRHASDRTHVAGLQATWDATRWLRVGCGVSQTRRTVSDNTANLTYPYKVNTASCTLQAALQP